MSKGIILNPLTSSLSNSAVFLFSKLGKSLKNTSRPAESANCSTVRISCSDAIAPFTSQCDSLGAASLPQAVADFLTGFW